MSKVMLVMFSGGLDSTGMLYHLLTSPEYESVNFHVHHVNIFNIEKRAAAESMAVKNILTYFNDKQYRKFSHSFSDIAFHVYNDKFLWDVDVIAFMSGYITSCISEIESIAIGATKGELDSPTLVENQKRAKKILSSFTEVQKVYPVSHLSKKELYDMLPVDLRELTWSCRTPSYTDKGLPVKCGKCKPCKDLVSIE